MACGQVPFKFFEPAVVEVAILIHGVEKAAPANRQRIA